MPEVQLPETHDIDGVYLVTRDDLVELDKIIRKAKGQISNYVSRQLEGAIENTLREWAKWNSGPKTPDEARKHLKERYPFSVKTQEIIVRCKSGRSIKGASFQEIADCSEIKPENPQLLRAEIRYADVQVSVELDTAPFTSWGRLRIKISPNDRAFADRVFNSFRDWAETKRRFVLWSKYNNWLVAVSFGLLSLWTLLLYFGLIHTPTSKAALFQRGWGLSNKGIDDSNQAEAVSILLRLATDQSVGTKVTGVHPWYVALGVAAVGGLVLSVCRPRSAIGIGRGCRKLRVQQTLGRIVRWLVGILIVGTVISLMGNWIYDNLKGSPPSE
jgi:hypothetical protein